MYSQPLSYLKKLLFLLAWVPLSLCAQEPPLNSGQGLVYVIPFQGEVEVGLFKFLSRGFAEAKENGAEHIIIEMDTPGGRVDAALEIVDLFLNSEIPVSLLVTQVAASAGAIISLSADHVFMQEGSTIGFSAPVLAQGGEMPETMEQKTLAYVLAEVRSICERRQHSEFKTRLAEAMVDKDIEIKDPDDPEKYIIREGKLLGLTAREAERLNFIDAEVRDREEVLELLNLTNARIIAVEEYAAERLARFLTSAVISSLLLTAAFLGIFIEFRTPGLGLPGLVGVVALALFFWGHMIAGLAGWEGLILLLVGVALLLLEVLVIPGFGVAGIAGILCIGASVVITLMDRPITSPHFFGTFEWSALLSSLAITAVTLTVGITGALLVPLLFPMMAGSGFAGWLVLKEKEDRRQGFSSAENEFQALLGRQGVAGTPLRPAGVMMIDGERVDVVSEGGFISAQTPVEVVKVEGRKVIVRPVR
jgi:membrane-bound serine protease (ClpP class)